MMKKLTKKWFILFFLLFSSCNDFTERNLKENFKKSERAEAERKANVQFLLTQKGEINKGSFSEEKLLLNTGIFVSSVQSKVLSDEIKSLDLNLNIYCNFVSTMSDSTFTLAKRNTLIEPVLKSWKSATLAYHTFNMMKFGPASTTQNDLMKTIYSFDREDKCNIDRALLQADRGIYPRFDLITNYSDRGLDGIEPLLFSDPNKSRCKRTDSRLEQWFAAPLIERENKSCQFMKYLMGDIVKNANKLELAWSPQGGDYTARLVGGELDSVDEAINEISQSFFALDNEIKDLKLAYPLGLEVTIDNEKDRCENISCPENTEHLYADMALESLYATYQGFQYLFFGINPITKVNGHGFDDLMVAQGHGKIKNRISEALTLAMNNIAKVKNTNSLKDLIAKIDSNGCEQTTIEKREVEVCALFLDLKKLTDLLKYEYLSALTELSAPENVKGDAD